MLGCGTQAWRPVLVTCVPVLSREAGMWLEPPHQGAKAQPGGAPHSAQARWGAFQVSWARAPSPQHLVLGPRGLCVREVPRCACVHACMHAGLEASLGITQAHKTGWGVGMK